MSVVVRWTWTDDLDDAELAEIAVGLGDSERARLDGYRHDIDRRRHLGVRLLLRRTLTEMLDVEPDAVALYQRCARCGGPHGRPIVTVDGRPGPHVSMTHAGAMVAVAISPSPVGIDLEPIAAAAPETPTRAGRHIIDLPNWVRTEALLKATGHGLEIDPALVGFGERRGAPHLTRWDGPGRRPVVRLADLAIADVYVASLARLGRRPLRIDLSGPVPEDPPAAATR